MASFFEIIKPLSPIVILTLSASLIILMELFVKKDEEKSLSFYIAVLGILAAIFTYFNFIGNNPAVYFGGSLYVDNFGVVISLIILVGGLLGIMTTHGFLQRMHIPFGEFYAVMLVSIIGMLTMSIANDLMTLYIGLEVMSISFYILVSFNRFNPNSNEGGMKYLILGSFSSAFLLFGISFLYGVTGSLVLNEIAFYYDSSAMIGGMASENLMFVGIGFLLIGFMFKIGAVPFHVWVPDVYQGAPAPITSILSTGSKIASFIVLFKTVLIVFVDFVEIWTVLLTTIAIISMLFGSFAALVQNNFKRLMAYSSIAHTGYILIAIIAAGVDPSVKEEAIESFVFYLAAYTLMTAGAFLGLVSAGDQKNDLESLESLKGYAYRNKFQGMCLSIMMFSLAGIPATAGFLGKYFIFKAAIHAQLYGLAIIGVIAAIISIYVYLKIVVIMYMKREQEHLSKHDSQWNFQFGSFIAALLTLILGFFPQLVFLLMNDIAFGY